MLLLQLPSGGTQPLQGNRIYGRGSPECLSDPLISRQQFQVESVCDGVVQLTNIGMNPIIVERSSADGTSVAAGPTPHWHVTDLLEKGDSTCLQANCRFYLASLQDTTTFTVVDDSIAAAELDPAAAAAGSSGHHQQQQQQGLQLGMSRQDQEAADAALAAALAAEEQQQQQWQEGSSSDEGGDSDLAAAAAAAQTADDSDRPSKRAKRCSSEFAAAGEPAGAQDHAAAAGRAGSSSSSSEISNLPDVGDGPFSLFAVRGLSSAYNAGFLGASLRKLVVSGGSSTGSSSSGNRLVFALASNYMVDMGWLLSACPDLKSADKLIVVHGNSPDRAADITATAAAAGLTPPRFTAHAPPLPITFGTHHSKGFLLAYADGGVRVIIHTANYIYADCNNKTQGLWYQDFPPKGGEVTGSSPFEDSLLDYMRCLQLPSPWSSDVATIITRADFSSARVALVASVPGYHTGPQKVHAYGHMRLRSLLADTPLPERFKQAGCIIQCSSLGSLDEKWLKQEFMSSMTAGRVVPGSSSSGGGGGSSGLGVGVDSAGNNVTNTNNAVLDASPGESARRRRRSPSSAEKHNSSSDKAAAGVGAASNAFAHMAAASRAQTAAAAGSAAAGPTTDIPLYIVWPSVSEVQHSREGWAAGYSIPGPAKNVTKPFLQRYWCRFDGSPVGRQSAMPHIKTYSRFIPAQQIPPPPAAAAEGPITTAAGGGQPAVSGEDGGSVGSGAELAWWLVTSHNLSKAAWGSLQVCQRGYNKGQQQLMIRSYELGVLATPQLEEAYLKHPHRFYSCTQATTPLATAAPQQQQPQQQVKFIAWKANQQPRSGDLATAAGPSNSSSSGTRPVYLSVPYSLPPKPYSEDDTPWCVDVQFSGLDQFGFTCGDAPFRAYGNTQPPD